jgi:hypothetical protein
MIMYRYQPVIKIGNTFLINSPVPVEASFVVGNWADDGGDNYYIDVIHNLNTLYRPSFQIFDSSNYLQLIGYAEVLDRNTMRIKVPKTPDCRFSGTIRLSGV